MNRYVVCKASELPIGERKIVEVNGRSIGVFNIKGEYYALRNLCPHQFAPLCLGKVTGYSPPSAVGEFDWQREGEIIRCPWHGWEFDIKTGKSIFNPHKVRTKSYDVKVESPACSHEGEVGDINAEGVETYEVEVEEGVVVLYT